MPTVSVDCALAHYLRSLEVDLEKIQDFYESLPHQDKPPLDECHIHFSALAPSREAWIGYGLHLKNAEPSMNDPLAPPTTTILIFVGSMIMQEKLSKLPETLSHELAHYARRNTSQAPRSDEEAHIDLELRLRQSGCLKIGQPLVIAVCVWLMYWLITGHDPKLWFMLESLVLIPTALWLINRKRRRARIRHLEEKRHNLYKNHETELDADHHANETEALAEITLQEKYPRPLIRDPNGKGVLSKTTDVTHKDMCRYPPSAYKFR